MTAMQMTAAAGKASLSMFFDNWYGLLRVVITGSLAYISLVVLLRVSGNRTLSKMNAFDLIVTVAFGSTLATTILSNSVALAEGVMALATLVGLQYAITWLSVRSKTVDGLVKSEPALLVYQGEMLQQQMRTSRVVDAEIMAAVREQGLPSLDQVEAIVLETDGTFSVMPKTESSQEVRALGNLPEAIGRS